MLRLPLYDCARAIGATLHDGDAAVEIEGVGIDTRTLRPGMLYAAIRGERFDGHDFLVEAERGGACAVLVEREMESALPQLVVDDARAALGTLARHWVRRHQVPIVAITGSNGKTTVKEIVAAILGQLGPVLATEGNLNNELGVPLTLFRLAPEHRYAIVEMGASGPGEIAALAGIAEPDVAVITNIGPAHLDGFGSLEGVARAKSELFAALDGDGVAVFDADDAFAGTLRDAAAHCRRCEFGSGEGAAVRGRSPEGSATDVLADVHGERLNAAFALDGEHNRRNALAAIAAARCLDVQLETIVAGIESVRAVPGRLQRSAGIGGATLIDDSYNANPASARAALDVLAAHAGERHLVLGDMAELGESARARHAEIGTLAAALGVHAIWSVGPLAEATGLAWREARLEASGDAADDGGHFDDVEALIASLTSRLRSGVAVLVKGSRSARMERVVEALRQERGDAPASGVGAAGESDAADAGGPGGERGASDTDGGDGKDAAAGSVA